jgi:HK97 family phage prohead protease
MDASEEKPVFKIRIYKEGADGWESTDTVVVHKGDTLTQIDALRSQELELIESRKTAMETAERITMVADIRSMATDDGSLKIAGYAATFNQEADGLAFREVIAPGAFTRTLASEQPMFLLVNHDFDALPLAATKSGTLVLNEDKVGLRMEATLDPANPRAQELASALSRGDVDKMSFAFTIAEGGDTREGGLRTLTDLDLYEISVVTMPAYSSTSVGMRSAEDEELVLRKRQLELKLKQLRLRKK